MSILGAGDASIFRVKDTLRVKLYPFFMALLTALRQLHVVNITHKLYTNIKEAILERRMVDFPQK
ncbi:hypothetical protein A6770_03005 [Nostoc minutum NIES-26]|uniref:Uncharacterized protein n=1 Tax=Nostoc minutum NIES-26 TaxID=1844469 RepID=A0A367QKB7_9NOSO|nr:hypothetical protein A6770_03005 [Nostoc minutum NIES-26]